MDLSPAEAAALGDLAQANLQFRDFVSRHPEGFERAQFARLEELGLLRVGPLQPWPTFVRRSRLASLARTNIELCKLIQELPRRVFASDLGHLTEFYGLDPGHAALAVAALRNPACFRGALARPDFMATPAGFKCLEFNVAGSLGGWQSGYWSTAYLEVPLIRRFVASHGLTPSCTQPQRRLFLHILRAVLRASPTREVNIAFIVSKHSPRAPALLELMRKAYAEILAELGGLRGELFLGDPAELTAGDGEPRFEGRRIHAVIEGPGVLFEPEVYHCWLHSRLLLYNGPLELIFSDKRNLALLSEFAHSELWSASERQVIEAAVPWTRRTSVQPAGGRKDGDIVTPELLLARREALVLKPGQSFGGANVHFGAHTSESAWEALVDQAFRAGTWVVQERLESRPYRYQFGENGSAVHDLVWGFFVFGESYGGAFLRMLPRGGTGIVNSAQGAVESVVLEVEDSSNP